MTKSKPPKQTDTGRMVTVRLPPDLIDFLDAWATRQRTAHPGRQVSQADAVRELLYVALTTLKGVVT